MSQSELNLEIKGLHTTPSDLSAVPSGAMEKAENVVCDAEGVLKPRRGTDEYGSGFGSAPSRAKKIMFYRDAILVHDGSKVYYSIGTSGSTWTAYDETFNEPGQRITSAESNKNLYFATATGVKKIDSITLQPKDCGAPKAIHFEAVTSGVSGFMPDSKSVNYRIVWGYRDQNGNLILGAPSQIVTLTNSTGNSVNTSLTIYIPDGISTSHFVQVYRSVIIDSTLTPSLELAQVLEQVPTSAEISAKVMTGIIDRADDILRGAFLYTAPSLGGVVVANDQPPLAKIVSKYKSYGMYCNTTSKYRQKITLLGTGSSSKSLQSGDYLKIGLRTYTAGAVENAASFIFKCVGGAGGAPTTTLPSEDIKQTCLSLCKVINQDDDADFYAFYISDSSTTPGDILLEERGIGSTVGFGIWSSRDGCYAPSSLNLKAAVTITSSGNLITPTDTTVPLEGDSIFFPTGQLTGATGLAVDTVYYVRNPTSTNYQVSTTKGGTVVTITTNGSGTASIMLESKNEQSINRFYYSKSEQFESVPILNYRDVGAADKKILAAIQLRESFIILKEDGYYRVSQEAPFQVDLIDSTQQLIGPDTAVVLNNTIYALSTQGVVAISDGGASVVDLPIEGDLLSLFGSAMETIKSTAFAVAYETDRRYILFLPKVSTDTYPTQAIVYNTFTKVWTKWVMTKTYGVIDPRQDRILFGNAVLNKLDIERKSFDYSDYVDYFGTHNIVSQSGTSLTISNADTLEVGDLIYKDDTTYTFILAVNSTTGIVTLLDPVDLGVTTVRVYKPIRTALKWTVQFAGNPSILKHYSEVSMYFKKFFPGSASASFSSDAAPGVTVVPIKGEGQSAGWGLFEWGESSWGNVSTRKPIRILVPRQQQRCSQISFEFSHAFAYGDWELLGASLLYNIGSHRIG